MALARLITRTPEYAQQLARSLHEAGYTVEFSSPEDTSSQTAELEVNLDDPSAASAYIVTADGREISFAYDPVEREFVLAPMWRKLKATATLLLDQFHKPKAEPLTMTPSEAVAVERPPVVESASGPAAPEPAAVVEEPEVHIPLPIGESLYLPVERVTEPEPEPIHFTGAEYFDGLGERRKPASQPAPEPEPVAPLAMETEASAVPRPSRLVQAALAAEGVRARLHERWSAARSKVRSGSRRWREYDRAWMRAVPTAAVITLAFLLGWGFANHSEKPAANAAPAGVEAKEEAAVPTPAAKPPMRVTAKPVSRPKPARYSEADEGEAADVVVRHYPKHYPSKGVQAANQRQVKRFSDLED